MKHYRVYAYLSQPITVHVRAETPDEALGNVRERLAVDHSPTRTMTVSQPHELGAWERNHEGVDTNEEILRGRPLTADERAYCNAREYTPGFDIDAFHGLQWSHIVDDGVPLCRTVGLWFCGGPFSERDNVSCPLCRSILRQEMRYEHLDLHAKWRHGSWPRAVATIERDQDGETLTVNGVAVHTVKHDDDPEDKKRINIWMLCDQINAAQAEKRQLAAIASCTPLKDGDYRRAAYLTKHRLSESDFVSDDRKAVFAKEAEAILAEMTPAEQDDIKRYFDR